MAALPVELIERIIDYIADYPSTLKACALTHPMFLPRCRIYQFQAIVLCKCSTFFRFQELIATTPFIATLTKQLTIVVDIQESGDVGPLPPIASILDHLQDIRSLVVQSKYRHGIRWNRIPYPSQEALYDVFSRPSLTRVSLHLCPTGSPSHAESVVQRCATKLHYLRLHCAMHEMTRASADSAAARLETLILRDPMIDPMDFVMGTLDPPLLDLGQLAAFELNLGAPISSLKWIQAVSNCCSHSLQTFVWSPTVIDLDSNRVEMYSLSQLPALLHLRIDTGYRGRPERVAPFLRHLLGTRSPAQVLKSLKVECDYFYLTEGYYGTFVEHMEDFVRGLTDVDHTIIVISGAVVEETHLQAAMEALRRSGLGGEFLGTSCDLEYELH